MGVRLGALLVVGVGIIAGCRGADGPSGTEVVAHAVGPESLTVSLVGAPDSVTVGASFDVVAIARNRTRLPVRAELPCPNGGLVIRLIDPQDRMLVAARTPCVTSSVSGASLGTLVPPGDSVLLTASGITPVVVGAHRLRADFEATGARAIAAERALIVRLDPGPREACRPSDSRIVFGLYVAPLDARTGAAVRATVVATDGAYRETLAPAPGAPGAPPPNYYGLPDRPGTYAVTVTADGFAGWRQDGVAVARRSDCHVESVFLSPRLTPNP